MYWFLLLETRERLDALIDQNIDMSAEQSEKFLAIDRTNGQRLMQPVSGRTATIEISGVLTPQPDWIAELFLGGNTTYPEIMEALAAADADASVDQIDLLINSPGGNMDGLFAAMDAIAGTKKPVRAVVESLAASAAYGLASQADEIVATRPTSVVGSIGVVTSRVVSGDVVEITSTNAPNKRPDASTEEGRAVIRAELDELEGEFIAAIANGRGVQTDKVKADFGQGGVMIAKNALAPGMIDGIMSTQTSASGTGTQAKTTESITMTYEEFCAKHPDFHAKAKAEGAKEARDLVEAHLISGQAGGEAGMKIALDAISKNEALTPKLQAQYNTAQIAKGQQDLRHEDDEDSASKTGQGSAKGASEEPAKDLETESHEAFLKSVGVEV